MRLLCWIFPPSSRSEMSVKAVMSVSREDIVLGGRLVSAVLLGREQGSWGGAEDTAVLEGADEPVVSWAG